MVGNELVKFSGSSSAMLKMVFNPCRYCNILASVEPVVYSVVESLAHRKMQFSVESDVY